MSNIRFKYDYFSAAKIGRLTPQQLIAYKHALASQADNLKSEATQWAFTYKILLQELQDRLIDLQCIKIEAEQDRFECDFSHFDIVTGVH